MDSISGGRLWVPLGRSLEQPSKRYVEYLFIIVPFCGVYFTEDLDALDQAEVGIDLLTIVQNNERFHWMCGGDIAVKSVCKGEPFQYLIDGSDDQVVMHYPFAVELESMSGNGQSTDRMRLSLSAQSEKDCDYWIDHLLLLQQQLSFVRVALQHDLQPSSTLFNRLLVSANRDCISLNNIPLERRETTTSTAAVVTNDTTSPLSQPNASTQLLRVTQSYFQSLSSMGHVLVFHTLTLSNCQLSDAHVPTLAQLMQSSPFIDTLDLSQNQLTSSCLRTLCERLTQSAYLRVLSLAMNAFTDAHIELLVDAVFALTQTNATLTSFSIARNKLTHVTAECFSSKLNLFARRGSLLSIDLSHNALGDGIVPMIVTSFRDVPAIIQRVDLSHCLISESAILQLSASLARCTSMRWLNLAGNVVIVPSSRVPTNLLRAIREQHALVRSRSMRSGSAESDLGVAVQFGAGLLLGVEPEAAPLTLTTGLQSASPALSLARTWKMAFAELDEQSALQRVQLFRRSPSLLNIPARCTVQLRVADIDELYSLPALMCNQLGCDLSQLSVVSCQWASFPVTAGAAGGGATASSASDIQATVTFELHEDMQDLPTLRPSQWKYLLPNGERLSSSSSSDAMTVYQSIQRACEQQSLWMRQLGMPTVQLHEKKDRGREGLTWIYSLRWAGAQQPLAVPIYASCMSLRSKELSERQSAMLIHFDKSALALETTTAAVNMATALVPSTELPVDSVVTPVATAAAAVSSKPVTENFESWIEKENRRREERRVNERLILAIRRIYAMKECSSLTAKVWEGLLGHRKHRGLAETELLLAMRTSMQSTSNAATLAMTAKSQAKRGSDSQKNSSLSVEENITRAAQHINTFVFPSVARRELVYDCMLRRDWTTLRVLVCSASSLASLSLSQSTLSLTTALRVTPSTGGHAYIFAQRLLNEIGNIQNSFQNLKSVCRSYAELSLVEDYLLQCAKCRYSGPEMFSAIQLRQELLVSAGASGSKFRSEVQRDFPLIQHRAVLCNLILSRNWERLRDKVAEVSLYLSLTATPASQLPNASDSAENRIEFDGNDTALSMSAANTVSQSSVEMSSMSELRVAQELLATYQRVVSQLRLASVSSSIETLDNALALAAYWSIYDPECEVAMRALDSAARNPVTLVMPIIAGLRAGDVHAVEKGFEECLRMGLQHEALDAVFCSKMNAIKNRIVQDDSIKDKLIKICLAIKNGFTIPPGEVMMLLRQAHKIKLNEDATMKPYFDVLGKHSKKFAGLQKQEQHIQRLLVDQNVLELSKVLSGRGSGRLLMSFPTAFARDQWFEQLSLAARGHFLPKDRKEQEMQQTVNVRRNAQTTIQIKKEVAEETEQIVFQGVFEKAARSEDNKGIRGWRRRFFILRPAHLSYYTRQDGDKKGSIRVLSGSVRKLEISSSLSTSPLMLSSVEREIQSKYPAKLYCLELEEGRDLSLVSKDLLDEARRIVRLARIREIERLLRIGFEKKSLLLVSQMLCAARELEVMLDFQLMNDSKQLLEQKEQLQLLRRVYRNAFLSMPKTHVAQALLRDCERIKDVAQSAMLLPSFCRLKNVVQISLSSPVKLELLHMRFALLNEQHAQFVGAVKALHKMDLLSFSLQEKTEFSILFLQFVGMHCDRLLRENCVSRQVILKLFRTALSVLNGMHIETEAMDCVRLLMAFLSRMHLFGCGLRSISQDQSVVSYARPDLPTCENVPNNQSQRKLTPSTRPMMLAVHSAPEMTTDLPRFLSELIASNCSQSIARLLSPKPLSKFPLLATTTTAAASTLSLFTGALFGKNKSATPLPAHAYAATPPIDHSMASVAGLGVSTPIAETGLAHQMLFYTKDIITNALLKLSPETAAFLSVATNAKSATPSFTAQEYQALCIEIFFTIQCVMGDKQATKSFYKKSRLFPHIQSNSRASSQLLVSREECIRALISIALFGTAETVEALSSADNVNNNTGMSPKKSKPVEALPVPIALALRDEMCVQLCKQLSVANPSLQSLFAGWRLMAILLQSFGPSTTLLPYLSQFAETQRMHFYGLSLQTTTSTHTSSATLEEYWQLSLLCETVRVMCDRLEDIFAERDALRDRMRERMARLHAQQLHDHQSTAEAELALMRDKESAQDREVFPMATILQAADTSIDISSAHSVPANQMFDAICQFVFDAESTTLSIVFLTGEVSTLKVSYGAIPSQHALLNHVLSKCLPRSLSQYWYVSKTSLTKDEEPSAIERLLLGEYETLLTDAEREMERAKDREREVERERERSKERDFDESVERARENDFRHVNEQLLHSLKEFSFFHVDVRSLSNYSSSSLVDQLDNDDHSDNDNGVRLDLQRLAVQANLALKCEATFLSLQWLLLECAVRQRLLQTRSTQWRGQNMALRDHEAEKCVQKLSMATTLVFRRSRCESLREASLSDEMHWLGTEFATRDQLAKRESVRQWLLSDPECGRDKLREQREQEHLLLPKDEDNDEDKMSTAGDHIESGPQSEQHELQHKDEGIASIARSQSVVAVTIDNDEKDASPPVAQPVRERSDEALPVDALSVDLRFAEDVLIVNSRLAMLSAEHFLTLIAMQIALCWRDRVDDDDDEMNDDPIHVPEEEEAQERALRKELFLQRWATRAHCLDNVNVHWQSSFDLTRAVDEDYLPSTIGIHWRGERSSHWQRIMRARRLQIVNGQERDLSYLQSDFVTSLGLMNPQQQQQQQQLQDKDRRVNAESGSSSEDDVDDNYRRRRRRRFDSTDSDEDSSRNQSDDSSEDDDDDDDDEAEEQEFQMRWSAEEIDAQLLRAKRERARPPLVRKGAAMTAHDEARLHDVLEFLGFRNSQDNDMANNHEDDLSSFAPSITTSMFGSMSLHSDENLRLLWKRIADFHALAVENDLSVEYNLRWRYLMKRAFHAMLVSSNPFYSHHLSPAQWTKIRLSKDIDPAYSTGEQSTSAVSVAEKESIEQLSRGLKAKESGVSVLCSVSSYGFYLLWPVDWSVILHAPLWDISNCELSDSTKGAQLSFSMNGLVIALRGTQVHEVYEAIHSMAFGALSAGLMPHAAHSFAIPVNSADHSVSGLIKDVKHAQGTRDRELEWYHSLVPPQRMSHLLDEFPSLPLSMQSASVTSTSSASLMALHKCSKMHCRVPRSHRLALALRRREEEDFAAQLEQFAEANLAVKNEQEIAIAREAMLQKRDAGDRDEDDDAETRRTDGDAHRRRRALSKSSEPSNISSALATVSPAERLLVSICGVKPMSANNTPGLLLEFPQRVQGRLRETAPLHSAEVHHADLVRPVLGGPPKEKLVAPVAAAVPVSSTLTVLRAADLSKEGDNAPRFSAMEQWRHALSASAAAEKSIFRSPPVLCRLAESAEALPQALGVSALLNKRKKLNAQNSPQQ